MPAYVLKCDGCDGLQAFLVHREASAPSGSEEPIERYCSNCHKTTQWTITLPERRSGRDRRVGVDRRA